MRARSRAAAHFWGLFTWTSAASVAAWISNGSRSVSIFLLEGSESPLLTPQPGLVIWTVVMIAVVALVLAVGALLIRRLTR